LFWGRFGVEDTDKRGGSDKLKELLLCQAKLSSLAGFASKAGCASRSSLERRLVRAEGVEPSSHAWEAHIIPIYYARRGKNGHHC
jgi:hypothetical protein